jgi:histone deacetylase complex regulatory component SIN3
MNTNLREYAEKKVITTKELGDIIDRIIEEERNKAIYKGVEFKGLTSEEINKKVVERIGTLWVIKDDR